MQSMRYLVSGELEMRSRSQPVQRDLPRPVDVNMAVLRPPHTDPPLTDLQKVSCVDCFCCRSYFLSISFVCKAFFNILRIIIEGLQ